MTARSRPADQPGLVGDHDQLSTITSTELGHRVADMGAGGGRAEEQLGADLVVAEPLPDQDQYLTLPLGQYRQPLLGDLTRNSVRRELSDESPGDPRREQRVSS